MTAAGDCTPVSWLRLERYTLGELNGGERGEIDAHLATCARCRACAEQLASEAAPALPPLPAVEASRAAGAALSARQPWFRRWFLPPRQLGFALAMGLVLIAGVLMFRPDQRVDNHHVVANVVTVKGGGDVSVELVREHDGSVAWEPTSFATGDRLKLLVTCAPPLQVHADLVVLQSDGPTFLAAPALLTCGNRVPVPPPFQITGPGAARVCVLLDATGPPSRALLPGGEIPAAVAHACVTLERAD